MRLDRIRATALRFLRALFSCEAGARGYLQIFSLPGAKARFFDASTAGNLHFAAAYAASEARCKNSYFGVGLQRPKGERRPQRRRRHGDSHTRRLGGPPFGGYQGPTTSQTSGWVPPRSTATWRGRFEKHNSFTSVTGRIVRGSFIAQGEDSSSIEGHGTAR